MDTTSKQPERQISTADIVIAAVFIVLAIANQLVLSNIHTNAIMEQGPFRPHDTFYLRTAFIILLLVGSNATLVLRRKYPIVPLFASLVALIVCTIWEPWLIITAVTLAFALCSTCIYSNLKQSLVALVVICAVLVFGIFRQYDFLQHACTNTTLLILYIAIAAVGNSIASRRAYTNEYEERIKEADRAANALASKRIEEERVSIAREIHDITAHSLSAISVQASAAERLIESNPDQAREAIQTIRTVSKESLAEVRSMIAALRDPDANAELSPTYDLARISELVDYLNASNIEVAVSIPSNLDSIPEVVSVAAFHILREAATNTVRHSGATHASITVIAAENELTIEFADDGCGIDRDSKIPEGHHGIEGMGERARVLGGTFNISNGEKGGCNIFVRIPYAKEG